MEDIISKYGAAVAVAPQIATDNTAITGETIDLAGYIGVDFFVLSGTLEDANATFDVALFADTASNMATAVEVTATEELLGGAAGVADFVFSEDKTAKRIGYRGVKRYVRLVITPSGNTGNAPFAAVAVLRERATL